MEGLIGEIAKHGLLGIIAALFLILYLRERAGNHDLQERRIAEMKEANEAYVGATDRAVAALNGIKDGFRDLKAEVAVLLRERS